MVKNICYHEPSILKNPSRKKKRKGTRGIDSAKNEPNRQLFDLYQTSLRASNTDANIDGLTAAPMSGQDSARKTASDAALPELASTQLKTGYETHSGESGVPRFGGASSKRLATGGNAMRPG